MQQLEIKVIKKKENNIVYSYTYEKGEMYFKIFK